MDPLSIASKQKKLLALEISTLAILVIIAMLSGWPLLEEWGLFHSFDKDGFSTVLAAASNTVRPLHLIPYWIQWILGGTQHPEGVAAATSLFLVLRYLAARWAISPYLNGYSRWAIATMAAALVPWDGAWLGRFASAQLAAVFFLLVVGFSIRLFRQFSIGWAIGCALNVLLMLLTYQGLFLCLALLPLGLLFLHNTDPRDKKIANFPIKQFLTVSFAIGLGCLAYGTYWFAISRLASADLYEVALASSASGLDLRAHVKAVFTTAYVHQSMALPLFIALLALLGLPVLDELKMPSSRNYLSGLLLLCIVLLPLVSLTYVNPLHLNDTDRVNYPIAMGLVLLATWILIYFSQKNINKINTLCTYSVVLIILTNSTTIGAHIRENVILQKNVLNCQVPSGYKLAS